MIYYHMCQKFKLIGSSEFDFFFFCLVFVLLFTNCDSLFWVCIVNLRILLWFLLLLLLDSNSLCNLFG